MQIRHNGVATTFIFDEDETGLVYLHMHGKGVLEKLTASGLCRVLTVRHAGHVFTSPASVSWLTARLTEVMERVSASACGDV